MQRMLIVLLLCSACEVKQEPVIIPPGEEQIYLVRVNGELVSVESLIDELEELNYKLEACYHEL